ncbi:winged helix-turn-helix domain-containing protein [Pseudoalteromonas denitrificans]|uniref:Transcriptional regulatory protein, C terminal n=1 Tax=Pseudoalteromonas denitrificans DSM 6059 TaxID=1123010 RepID=A0A1I1RTQ1_9GAMM|nr:winged helix-turn-helix domain-containing protein [Pseudoalteromonas denitrificans]SFD37746.1 Transcriptional regulatory protein, C terminal [Pseudoalteromonas denitrificans DSM 6059]
MNKNNELEVSTISGKYILQSGDLCVNLIKQQAYFKKKPIKLPILSYRLLISLMKAWPHTKSQDELIELVWGKVQVQNSTLNQRVKLLRQSLNAHECDFAYIALVRGIGYRFSEEVITITEEIPQITKTTERKSRLFNWKYIAVFIILFGLMNLAFQFSEKRVAQEPVISLKELRQSITVLPFCSSDLISTDDTYLTHSFSLEVLNSLAQVRAFKVIAYDKFTRAQLTELNTNQIGEKLHIDNLIKGNITRANNGYNVDIKLISTHSNIVLWTHHYQVSKKGLYFLKSDIVRDVKQFLLPDNTQQIQYRAEPSLVNPKAYDFYLKAMDYHRRNSLKDNKSAVILIKNAYALSPSCLDIISGYAAILNRAMRLGSQNDDAIALAMSLSNKAISLYPDAFKGYVALANSYVLQQNDAMAFEFFNKALSLSNENIYALTGLLRLQIKAHQFKKALKNINKLKVLDPGSTNSLLLSGDMYLSLNLHTQAKQNYDAVIKIEPDNIDALMGLARINIKKAKLVNAKKQYQLVNDISKNSAKSIYLLMEVLFAEQKYKEIIHSSELNKHFYAKSIYATSIDEIKILAKRLVNPDKHEAAIAKMINGYQNALNNKQLEDAKFSYLIQLMKSTGQNTDIVKWNNIQDKLISQRQKSLL